METILAWVQNHRHVVVVLAVFLETAGVPIPGEIVLLIAGALSFSQAGGLVTVILAGSLAAVLGDLMLFLIGRRISEKGERRFVQAYCRWTYCTLGSAHCHQRARQFLESFDVRALFFAKFIFGARQFMAPVAGMARVDPLLFVIFDAAGSTLWVATVTVAGYLLRTHLTSAMHLLAQFKALAALGLVLLAVGFILRRAWNFRRYGAPQL
jgi:membrane protein DedA with SNARE-associated domain